MENLQNKFSFQLVEKKVSISHLQLLQTTELLYIFWEHFC